MKAFKTSSILGLVLVCAALTLSLSVPAQAQTVTNLVQFPGNQAHAMSVIQAADGNFYGAAGGGTYNQGTIFRMTPAGALTTIYNFCSLPNCADGQDLSSSPILGSDGDLYGVVPYGGNTTNSGTFYKLTLDGQITILYTFCSATGCADGGVPHAVIQGRDGNFYGATGDGGANNHGTFFQISPAGAFTVLYSFCSLANCTDGNAGNVIQGIDGNFYGTGATGTFGGGDFYQMTPEGKFKVLYNFCIYSDLSCTAGSYPSPIVQDAKGNFFGTTQYGAGRAAGGTVFEITSKIEYHVLHWFDINHGNEPLFGLTLANDGNLYGMENDGGFGGTDEGSLFEITPKGVYTNLYAFPCCSGPYDPWTPLFQGTDGLFYGGTLYDHVPCCNGVIFSLDNGLRPLVEPVPAFGKAGKTVLILGNGLTGTTSVKFAGVAAQFTVASDTYIQATVPAGAKTGTVSVVTPSGTLNSSPQFVVTK